MEAKYSNDEWYRATVKAVERGVVTLEWDDKDENELQHWAWNVRVPGEGQ